jgi:hypothetical protein
LALLFLRALRSAAGSSPSGGFGPSDWPLFFCGHYDVQQVPPRVEVSGPLDGPSLSAGTTTCSSYLPPLWGASRIPTCYPPRLRFPHIFLPFNRGAQQHGFSSPHQCNRWLRTTMVYPNVVDTRKFMCEVYCLHYWHCQLWIAPR